jgi:hypothetical protein
LWLCFVFSVSNISCDPNRKFSGTYKAIERESPRQKEIQIELKENGEGAWRVGDEEVSFSWYLRRNELRLNTKAGGIIIGKFEGNALNIILPGARALSFRKSE